MSEQETIMEESSVEEQNVSDEVANTDADYLVPVETYLKTGIHIGTKYKTKDMQKYIYKTRADGLSILDLQKIDAAIREATEQLAKYQPEEIVVVCRRENGWDLVKKMGALTGIRAFPGRYPPGILTNTDLENFQEAKVMLVTDVWPDKNAVADAKRVGIPVFALCDTNNLTHDVKFIVPLNNKGRKSLGLFYFLFAREYLFHRGLLQRREDFADKLLEFVSD